MFVVSVVEKLAPTVRGRERGGERRLHRGRRGERGATTAACHAGPGGACGAAGMARPAEKIAQLEAALEKKDQEISVLKLTTRRLEEELNQLKVLVEEGFDAADQKTEEVKKALEDRMNVIEGASWSGRLTSKYLTASERLKIEPDVGILFALSTGSKTITSDSVKEQTCVALSEVLRTQDCRVEVLELAHSTLGVRGTIMLSQTMSVNSVLTTLNLASCGIGAAGAIALWHYCKATKCPLEVIDIRDNNVGLARVVEAMEQAVHKKTTLRAVGFDFSRDALIESCRVVQQDPDRFHLHAPPLLDLSSCSIMDQDVPAVVSLLLRISVTTSVNLNNNEIGDEAATELMKVLEVNECIEAIALANNPCQAAILLRETDLRIDVWACLYPSKTVRFDYLADFDENVCPPPPPSSHPHAPSSCCTRCPRARILQNTFPLICHSRRCFSYVTVGVTFYLCYRRCYVDLCCSRC